MNSKEFKKIINKNYMEQNQNQENLPVIKKRKHSIKWKIYFALILILLSAGAYGYYWYRQTNRLRLEAQQVINRAEKLDNLEQSINIERNRCEEFIARQEGDFGSFEYCNKFLDWVDKLPI